MALPMNSLRLMFSGTCEFARRPDEADAGSPATLVGVTPDCHLTEPPPDALYGLIGFQPPVALPRDEALRWVRSVVDVAMGTGGEVLTGPRGIVLRVALREVMVAGFHVDLTTREFDVLRLLLQRQDEVLTPDEIASQVWGHGTFGSRNFVESQISRLRTKLTRAGAPNVITTLRARGYVVRAEVARSAEADYPAMPAPSDRA